jgi:hypothetical protein
MDNAQNCDSYNSSIYSVTGKPTAAQHKEPYLGRRIWAPIVSCPTEPMSY